MKVKPHLISSFHLYWGAKGKPEEIYKGNTLLPIYEVSFVCPLCGFESHKGFRWKDVNLSLFTNWDWFCDDVPYLCPACTAVLKDDRLKRRDVIVTENEVIYLQKKNLEDREKIVDFIFKPNSTPFVVKMMLLHLTKLKKKSVTIFKNAKKSGEQIKRKRFFITKHVTGQNFYYVTKYQI